MTLHAYQYNIVFELITPGCCHVSFMMEKSLHDQRLKDHRTWYCPSCGSNRHFTGDSEETKLKKQLETERNTNKFLRKQNETERNRTRAQKGAKTRIINRVKNGVCPCCNRTFKQLAKHMENKHPEYVGSKK